MATNNTYINAQDDFIVKGNLTVEGNVTQVSTTIESNRVEASEFIINSDGTNTTARLSLNSNNSLANISFVDGGNMVVEPNLQGNIIIGAGQTLTVASGASISGNVFSGNLTGVASEATMFTDLVKIEIGGNVSADATGSATFQGAGNVVSIPMILDSVNSNAGSWGDAATVPTFTVNAKGLITAASENAIVITSSQVTNFNTSSRALFVGGEGITYSSGTGTFSLSDTLGPTSAGTYGSASAVPVFLADRYGRIGSILSTNIAITASQVTDFTTVAEALFSVTDTGGDGSLAYNNTTGVFTYTGPSAAETRAHISVTDNGGDGSLAYNSSTGVITYTGPSASETRAHFTGGTGIDISSGTVAIDSTVVTKADTQTINGDKTFTGTVDLSGATIPGTVTFSGNIIATNIDTVTQTDSIITDNNIYLNQGGSDRDAKIQVERSSANAYLKWDHGTSRWQFSNNGSSDNNMLLLSDFSSGISSDIVTTGKVLYSNMYSTEGSLPSASTYHGMFAHVHGTGKGYFAHGGNWIKLLDETSSTTSNLTEGSNLYYTDERVDDRVNSLLVDGDGITGTYNDGAGSYTLDVDNTVARTTTNLTAGDGLSGGGTIASSRSFAVDSTVIRTTGDQSLAGDKTFTGKLVVPTTATTEANALYSDGNEAYIYIDGVAKQITPTASVGSVEDVGTGEIDFYAGTRIASNVTYHGIKSISSGTYTSVSESANVVTVEGDISAIRGAFSAVDNAGDGTFTYNSSTGAFSYSGVSQSQIRGEFSASGGTLSYDSGTGTFTSTADNYNSWSFDTESGSTETVTSGEEVTFTGGTGIDITHSGNDITIVNTSTADISGVSAGTGLSGGGTSGTVTLSADQSYIRGSISASGDISYNSSTGVISFTDSDRSDATIRGLFSATGDISYNSSTGVFSFTDSDRSDATIRGLFSGGTGISYNSGTGAISLTDTGYITGVTAGTGLSGGGTSGTATLDLDQATSSELGGVKIGYSENGKNYPVELSSGKMYVNVPWVDTNTTYSAGTGLTLSGTQFNVSGLTTSEIAAGSLQLGTESFADSDSVLMTAAAVQDKILSYGYTTHTGDITNVSAGTGLSGGGSSGSVTLDVADLTVNELAAGSLQTSGESFADNDTSLMTSAAIEDKILSYGYTTDVGDITGVTASTGLSGGGSSGSVSLSVDLGDTGTFTSTNTASKAVVRDGSGNFAAGTITATATQAQYADLAEKYESDADYEPGTVLVIGGDKEVTVTDEAGSYKVVGVVSTDPAYLMNSQANGVAVALRGRVPCKVIGNVNKGDVLVTSDTPGYAMVGAMSHSLSSLQIIGRALESKTDAQPGIIEIIV